jgi:hypothetical protein
MAVRRVVWAGSGLVAVLLLVAAVIGLRGTPPDRTAQSPGEARAPAAAPSQPAPAAKPALPPPSFDIVTVDRQGQAVIAGRAAPGDKVKVLDAGKPIGEVTADARGEWVLVPAMPMIAGDRQLELEATSREGGPARRSADAVALSITSAPSGEGASSALAVLLPGDKNRPAQILQRLETAPEAGPLALDAAEYATDDRLALSGRAGPGARVAIYAGDRPLGTAVADAAGKWVLNSHFQRPSGASELRLEQLGRDGAVAFRIALPFDPTGPAPAPTAGADTYVVQRGNSLWVIARQIYGNGARYTAIYRGNQDQIEDPDRIYPGQQFKLPKS